SRSQRSPGGSHQVRHGKHAHLWRPTRGGHGDHGPRTRWREGRGDARYGRSSGPRMIVTVTPNPSIDRTLVIDSLARGHLVRARASTVDPGGKGVNVSMALARNGCPTTAVIP